MDDVSHYLGVTEDTIYPWMESRNLPAHHVERLRKFELTEVDEWVRAGGVDVSDDPAEAGTRSDGETGERRERGSEDVGGR